MGVDVEVVLAVRAPADGVAARLVRLERGEPGVAAAGAAGPADGDGGVEVVVPGRRPGLPVQREVTDVIAAEGLDREVVAGAGGLLVGLVQVGHQPEPSRQAPGPELAEADQADAGDAVPADDRRPERRRDESGEHVPPRPMSGSTR